MARTCPALAHYKVGLTEPAHQTKAGETRVNGASNVSDAYLGSRSSQAGARSGMNSTGLSKGAGSHC